MAFSLLGIILSLALAAAFIAAFVFVIYLIFKKKNNRRGCPGCTSCQMASGCEKRMEPRE